MKRRFVSQLLLITSILSTPALAGTETEKSSDLANWWKGKTMLGNWHGARDSLASRGVSFSGKWEGDFFAILNSQNDSRQSFDEEFALKIDIDLARLTMSDYFEGWTAFGEGRYRRPLSADENPGTHIEATGMFNPAHFQSGTEWRLANFGIAYSTPELFGIKNFLTFRAGWLEPSREFVVQPLAGLFINAAINSARGIGGNIQWTSSYSAWGGTLQIRPTKDVYIKGGLFAAMPTGSSSSNHGLAFAGYGPDTGDDDLMAVSEIGFTPQMGAARLPGKYAMGGYYFGGDTVTANGSYVQGQYGFYFQGDQMIYRERSNGQLTAPSNEQGLSFFSFATFSREQVPKNKIPLYLQAGLVYRGLIPARDKDQTLLGIGYGSYNNNDLDAVQNRGIPNQRTSTTLVEIGYRVQLNSWAYFQPFLQHIHRPNGTGDVQDATILGLSMGLQF